MPSLITQTTGLRGAPERRLADAGILTKPVAIENRNIQLAVARFDFKRRKFKNILQQIRNIGFG
jgi:hypothetical protein